jgi:hypothetical protein
MTELTLLAAFLLAVVATARLTRLLIHDAYPPTVALRLWWWNQTVAKGGWRTGWHRLLVGDDPDDSGCPFCAAPYLSAIVLAVGMAAGIWQPGWSLAGVWWTGAVWATLSYLAAIFVVRDEPLDA